MIPARSLAAAVTLSLSFATRRDDDEKYENDRDFHWKVLQMSSFPLEQHIS